MTIPPADGLLKVKRLAAHDAEALQRWDAFVARCPEATFFHRAGWQTIIGEVFRHSTHLLYAERIGEIEGVLPLGHV